MAARLERAAQDALAVALILMMACIVLQVLCNALDINPLLRFATPPPFFGPGITLNSLLDLQWHLLVLIGLLPAGLVWLQDRHVRVDFLYNGWGPVARVRLDLGGNLIFAAPFLWMALPATWTFMARAWRADEGSRNGGLLDLWLIKSALPLGLSLLAMAVAWETLRLARQAR